MRIQGGEIIINKTEAEQIIQWWGLSDSCHGHELAKRIEDFVTLNQSSKKKCPKCAGTNTREKILAHQNDDLNTEDYCNDCKEFFFIIRQNQSLTQEEK